MRCSDESQKTIKESLTRWLQVFKFPSVERTTYDRLECTANHQIYPLIGEKIVGDITAADLKSVLNYWMEKGYAYTTVKKVHILLNEYFRYLTEESFIQKNPMQSVPMMKKSNFLAAQDKECVPEQEAVTVFTPTEIAKFKREAFATVANGKRKYQQAAAYILMLNTGLRTGELLGLINSDIDLERRVLRLERGVKEVWRRDGLQAEPGRDVKVGKLKSATSKRTVPLNDTAIAMIQDLRKEAYFGENTPLVPDEHGDFTRPVNFRKRYYRIEIIPFSIFRWAGQLPRQTGRVDLLHCDPPSTSGRPRLLSARSLIYPLPIVYGAFCQRRSGRVFQKQAIHEIPGTGLSQP